MSSSSEGRTVAGVDGSVFGRDAARWAAGEAARREQVLELVYADVFALPALPELPGISWTRAQHAEVRTQVQHWLNAARRASVEQAPNVEVTTAMRPGRPETVLVEESRSADLVVVGDRGLGGFTGMLAGSVAVTVAAHSQCPTVVVRQGPERTSPVRSDAPVVVGLDGPHPRTDVLAHAFAMASSRGVSLELVHTWHVVGVDSRWLRAGLDSAEIQQGKERWISELVDPLAVAYPEVVVDRVVTPGAASTILLERAQHAQLVVVGTRGHGNVSGMLLGSTSQPVLHYAPCPVMVIPR